MKHILNYSDFLIINENKLYPQSIVNNISKKLGDTDDVLNKIAIFGLFRNTPPFLGKDIQNISKSELDNLYNEWFDKTATKLSSIDGNLKGNRNMAVKYMNAYINNVRKLPNIKPFSFKNYEETLVDIVNNNDLLPKTKSNFIHNITNPDKKDIIYDDENICIVKGDTKEKCVIYGNGYSWCISQSDLNYYTTYRIKDKATIYFVLNKNLDISHKERLCVILRYPNDVFSIADKSNSGNRSGSINSGMNGFRYIESQLPWLKGMEQYFPYKNVTLFEKNYYKQTLTPYHSADLKGYIVKQCELLKNKVNYVDFFRDYMINNNIYDNQISSLDDAMLTQLVEIGKTLENSAIKKLPSKYKVRYATVMINNGSVYTTDMSDFTYDEIDRVLDNCKEILQKRTYARDLIGAIRRNKDVKEYITNKIYGDVAITNDNYKTILFGTSDEKQLDLIYQKILPSIDLSGGHELLDICRYISRNSDKFEFFKYCIKQDIPVYHLADYVGDIFLDYEIKLEMAKMLFDKYKYELGDMNYAHQFELINIKLGKEMVSKFYAYIKPFIIENKVVFHKTFQDSLLVYVPLLSERYMAIRDIDSTIDNSTNILRDLSDTKIFNNICKKLYKENIEVAEKHYYLDALVRVCPLLKR